MIRSLIVMLASSVAAAQVDLHARIDALGAEDLATRDAAEASLLADPMVTLADIESGLATHGLSAEQRMRLENVGRELFTRTPKAGLGVRFGDEPRGGGVALAAVVAEFPAAALLRAGDVIRSINGQAVDDQTHMGAIILSHEPGQTLRVEIDRPRNLNAHQGPLVADPTPERLVLDVPLGRYEDLATGVQLTAPRLEASFRQRLARSLVVESMPPLIGGAIGPLEWLAAEGYDAGAGMVPATVMHRVPAWRLVSFGGQPPSAVGSAEMRRGDPATTFARASRAFQADGQYDRLDEALAGYRALAHRLGEIRDELDQSSRTAEGDLSTRRLEILRQETGDVQRALDEIHEFFRRYPPGTASGQAKPERPE